MTSDATRTDAAAVRANTALLDVLEGEFDAHTTIGRHEGDSGRALAAMRALPKRGADELLEQGELIGEGGMGVVRAARQRAVGRGVAVKALHGTHRGEAAEVALLQEAWLTASLEHPNVVPVHDVLFDEDQGPLIVLKHVRGIAWSDVMGKADEVRARFRADDLLQFNLETLMQICRAVHFAHANNVVHRDIKPANVMLGAYGEVYLLDWGIALSMVADPAGRLPVLSDDTPVAGTLGYMAPEMIDREVGVIGPHTDVYQLGAVLYEIVAGHAPHTGDDRRQIAFSILESRPRFPQGTPEGLQHIVSRAMSRDPLERHESADALRLDVQRFLRSRDSMRLVDEALVRYGDLTWLLETRDGSNLPKERLFELFGQCRFGLQQALLSWSENVRARSALRNLLDRMIVHLLTTDDPGGAGALLAEHPEPDAGLVAQVECAVETQKEKQQELERLQRDLDPWEGAGARRMAMVAMGIAWTLAPLLANVIDPEKTPMIVNYVSPVVLLVLALGVWYAARDRLSKTAINRRFLIAMLVGFCAHMVHLLIVPLAGLAPKTELPMGMVSFGAIAAILAYTAEKRLWPLVPLYWVAALVAAWNVANAAYVISACNLVLTLYMFAIWSPRKDQPAT